jgi:hypothetical protein
MSSSFWKEALARLPQHLQRRHAAAFEAAERFERIFEMAWDAGQRILAPHRRLAAQEKVAEPRPLEIKAHRQLFPR